MIRFFILLGFALMFSIIHQNGQLNMYINTKYAYLSISAIVLLLLLAAVEFVRVYRLDKDKETRQACESANNHTHHHEHHDQEKGLHRHHHDQAHQHDHDDHYGLDHSHEPTVRWKRVVGYLILFVPICTGIFLPVQTLDSSFVKAKGFSFPTPQEIDAGSPGEHQFLKPDSSVFYGKEGYDRLKNKELAEFVGQSEIQLDDSNYMKGMEVIYNFPANLWATVFLSPDLPTKESKQMENITSFFDSVSFIAWQIPAYSACWWSSPKALSSTMTNG